MTTEDTPVSFELQYKRLWNDGTSKLLMEVFKEYYELWKNGQIEKKNQMWAKITEDLNKKGLDCTASQAENRFKTLIRSYRKSCGITPGLGRNGRKTIQQFTEDFADIFIGNMSLLQGTSFDEDSDAIIVNESNQGEDEEDTVQQFLDESTGSIFTLQPQMVCSMPRKRHHKIEVKNMFNISDTRTIEDKDEDEADDDDDQDQEDDEMLSTRKRTRFLNRTNNQIEKQILDKTSFILNKRKTVPPKKQPVTQPVTTKTNTEVLMDIKELLKKIEIRRQARHEQNIKIAKERNEILKRKNELLQSLLDKD